MDMALKSPAIVSAILRQVQRNKCERQLSRAPVSCAPATDGVTSDLTSTDQSAHLAQTLVDCGASGRGGDRFVCGCGSCVGGGGGVCDSGGRDCGGSGGGECAVEDAGGTGRHSVDSGDSGCLTGSQSHQCRRHSHHRRHRHCHHTRCRHHSTAALAPIASNQVTDDSYIDRDVFDSCTDSPSSGSPEIAVVCEEEAFGSDDHSGRHCECCLGGSEDVGLSTGRVQVSAVTAASDVCISPDSVSPDSASHQRSRHCPSVSGSSYSCCCCCYGYYCGCCRTECGVLPAVGPKTQLLGIEEQVLVGERPVKDAAVQTEYDEEKQVDADSAVTEIFLRPSVLSDLECRREDHIRDSLVLFQSVCRSYLARKRFKHLQVQQLAIRCIQRNVRLYQGVRNWSWWRLFTKIAPLLDVHRTERQLRTATEELTKLRAQLAKTEEERSSYKQERDALEGKMGEMVGELQDERHTSGMATRRLQQEQCDKQQLQRQLGDTRREFDRMCLLNEQLASELSAQNSGSGGGGGGRSTELDDDDDDDGALYSRQVEHITRQLHYTQKQMQQQRDDSEEQLAAVRKQLERKLEAAVETADEQKQLVAQLKRKVARLVGEAADQKVHLDEQVARNNVLERRQRKFDSDMQTLADDLKRERLARERVCQEKDQLQSETYSLRNEVSALRLELEMCEEKAAALRRELDSTQSSDQLHATDEETPQQLRRARLELQRLCDEREEQLEDSAGQVALLEQAKLRLEMCLQQARQQHRLELTQKDDELDELRASIVKKVKALESQLELEHEERQQLVRDKHELERQLVTLGENTLCADSRHQDTEQRLRRQLKRTRALLADAQLQLDSGGGGGADGSGGAGIGKGQLRQMRNQLEDAEFAAAAATRGRLAAESELQELQLAMEEVQRAKSQAESRATGATRQVSQLQSQLDEQDDELQEVMRKYKSCVAQLSADQTTLADQNNQLEQLQLEVGQLREQLADSTARCQQLAGDSGARDDQRRLELRVRELDSRLDFEAAGKQRVERQLVRVREQLEQAGQLAAAARERELSSGESLKKLQRQLREAREELAESQRRETDSGQQLSVLSKQLEQCHAETAQSRSDLRLALKRIADLQNAMQGELESDELSNSDDSLSHSEDEIDDVDSFLSARLPSSLLLTAPSATAATSVENGSSALSPDSTCFNNNNNSSHSGSSESNNNNKTAD